MYFSETQNISTSCQNTVKLEIAVEIYKNFSIRSIKIHRPFLLQLSNISEYNAPFYKLISLRPLCSNMNSFSVTDKIKISTKKTRFKWN